VTLRYVVGGVVQGVGFRYFVVRRAVYLGLVGWTRNLPDGRVEVVAKGELEQLGRLEEALRRGPSLSRVTAVEKSEISDDVADASTFEIR
jgi:acylphosphatase